MMSALTPVKPGIWRWDGVDADHGFPIVGYAVNLTGHLLLIDPPGTSGSEGEILAIGRPEAIALTSEWHVRGAPRWAKSFGISIAAHASATRELQELGGSLDIELKEGDEFFGWQVLHLHAASEQYQFDELVYWDEKSGTLIIGDLLAEKEDGTLAFGPELFGGIPVDRLRPLADRLASLRPQLVLSAHLGPREDTAHVLGGFLE